MKISNILELSPSWLADGDESDVVLSCRARLARNIKESPFPAQANEKELAFVLEKAKLIVPELCNAFSEDFIWVDLEQLSEIDRMVLVEKHLISPLQALQPRMRAAIVSEDGTISIMVNEEDHFRIQVMHPGLDLKNVLSIADKIDDIIENSIDYAFDENYGYLTACPTNIGTALRVTAMLHMPGLAISQQIDNMVRAAAQVGLIVRGMYGEGSEVIGDIFQVSNQLAMGYNEAELVEGMSDMVRQIASQERNARSTLYKTDKLGIEDMVWRAYGQLMYARLLKSKEAMSLYSKVLLGINLGFLKVLKNTIYELMINTRKNHICRAFEMVDKYDYSKEQLRAEIVRHKIIEVSNL